MNWFQRHLNYTVLLSWVALYPLFIMFIFVFGFVLEPYIKIPDSIAYVLIWLLLIIFGLALPLFVSGWALRRKNRRLWWLLIIFVPYVGGIVFLCLENRSEWNVLKAGKTPRLVPIEKKAKSKMKMVTGILLAIIIAIIVGLVPIIEVPYSVTEPLSYQGDGFVRKEERPGANFVLSTVAFSKDQAAISAALHEAYKTIPVAYVTVKNTDVASGTFTVRITFYTPTDQYTNDITLQLRPGELETAKYYAYWKTDKPFTITIDADKDEWSWKYEVTPDTKVVNYHKKVPLLDYWIHY